MLDLPISSPLFDPPIPWLQLMGGQRGSMIHAEGRAHISSPPVVATSGSMHVGYVEATASAWEGEGVPDPPLPSSPPAGSLLPKPTTVAALTSPTATITLLRSHNRPLPRLSLPPDPATNIAQDGARRWEEKGEEWRSGGDRSGCEEWGE